MWPLNLIRWKKATGVIIEDDRVTLSIAAATLGGVQVLRTQEVSVGDGGLRAALTELTEKKKLPGLVLAGLDARKVYFTTKEAPPAADDEEEPTDLLPPTLAGGSKYISHHIQIPQRKRRFLSVGACGRGTARDVLAGLRDIKSTRMRLEPLPFALQEAARRRGKTPRRWRCVIRVLLDGTDGVAFLENQGRVLAWRPFRAAEGDPAAGIASAVRGLRVHGLSELDLATIDGLLLHCDGAVAELQEDCEEYCGIETRLQPFLALDASSSAASLASAGLRSRTAVPDLLTKLKPPPSIRDMFPWGVAMLLLVVVLGTGYELSSEADRIEGQTRMAKRQTALDALKARVKVGELKKKHGELSLEMQLLYNFVVSRVSWADVMRELPERVPGSVVLAGLRGRDSFTMPSNTNSGVRKLETKEITLQGQGRLASGEAAPEDISALMESLAASAVLMRSFPRVDGANVIRKPGKGVDAVSFVAKCSKPRW